MLENVIVVDFSKKRAITSPNSRTEQENYLSILAEELDELDFHDVVEGINDPLFYPQMDPELRLFVDGFYACAG